MGENVQSYVCSPRSSTKPAERAFPTFWTAKVETTVELQRLAPEPNCSTHTTLDREGY